MIHLVGGYIAVTCGLIGSTVLTKLYGGTDSPGNRAATFFIFSIIVVYVLPPPVPTTALTTHSYTIGIEAASFVYTSEIFPTELRAQGVAFSMQGLFLSSILWTAVAAPAFAGIGVYFYIVFIFTSVCMIAVVYILFPETKGYTLEQLSTVFGDEVVDDEGHHNEHHGSDPSAEDLKSEVVKKE